MRVFVLYGINNRFFKKKFQKNKNFKFRERKNFEKIFLQVCCDYHSVFGLSFDAYIRASVRVKAKKLGIFPDVDAIKYQKIRFKPLFKPTERISTLYPNSCPSRRF